MLMFSYGIVYLYVCICVGRWWWWWRTVGKRIETTRRSTGQLRTMQKHKTKNIRIRRIGGKGRSVFTKYHSACMNSKWRSITIFTLKYTIKSTVYLNNMCCLLLHYHGQQADWSSKWLVIVDFLVDKLTNGKIATWLVTCNRPWDVGILRCNQRSLWSGLLCRPSRSCNCIQKNVIQLWCMLVGSWDWKFTRLP